MTRCALCQAAAATEKCGLCRACCDRVMQAAVRREIALAMPRQEAQ